jgi:hypothetical protein
MRSGWFLFDEKGEQMNGVYVLYALAAFVCIAFIVYDNFIFKGDDEKPPTPNPLCIP